eukprot:scpid42214/ scgid5920/ Protein FAM208A; CTCL tumor antigen se89-1; Retinoblastoma-associated protein RAP140
MSVSTNFTIPKKRAKDLFEPVENESREGKEVLRQIHLSFSDPDYSSRFQFSSIRQVHSPRLDQYSAWRKEKRNEGYGTVEMEEKYCFLAVRSESESKSLCERGLEVSKSSYRGQTCLGDPVYGVYLHSTVAAAVDAIGIRHGKCMLIIFKASRGRVKAVAATLDDSGRYQRSRRAHTDLLQPAPNFDTHIARAGSKFVQNLLYMYEFDDEGLPSKRPRQCCPFAIVDLTLLPAPAPAESGMAAASPTGHTTRRLSSHSRLSQVSAAATPVAPLPPSTWTGGVIFTSDNQTTAEITVLDVARDRFCKHPNFGEELKLTCVLPRASLAAVIPLDVLDQYSDSSEPLTVAGGLTAQWLHVSLGVPHEYARQVLCSLQCVQLGAVGVSDELLVLLTGHGDKADRPMVLWLIVDADATVNARAILQKCYEHCYLFREELSRTSAPAESPSSAVDPSGVQFSEQATLPVAAGAAQETGDARVISETPPDSHYAGSVCDTNDVRSRRNSLEPTQHLYESPGCIMKGPYVEEDDFSCTNMYTPPDDEENTGNLGLQQGSPSVQSHHEYQYQRDQEEQQYCSDDSYTFPERPQDQYMAPVCEVENHQVYQQHEHEHELQQYCSDDSYTFPERPQDQYMAPVCEVENHQVYQQHEHEHELQQYCSDDSYTFPERPRDQYMA